MVETINLDNLRADRRDLQRMLAQEQQKLIDAQNACLRFGGGLTYNAQCITYLENLEKEVEPSSPEEK